MPNTPYADFIETCRLERASLTGLIEAIENQRMDPGAPIDIPPSMIAVTDSTLVALQTALVKLQALVDAYEAIPNA